MKKIEKIVGLVLSLCLTFGAFSSVVSFAAEEVGAKKAYEKNAESFYTSLRFKEDFAVISVRGRSQTSELVYPDNFGGLYIDSDNELHIAYTDNKETLMNKVGEDEAIFEKVDYGYNYLNGIFEYITALMCTGETSISQAYVDETTNRVAVYLEASLRDELIVDLKESFGDFDENAISFRDAEPIVTTSAAGAGIVVTDGAATAGYNAQDYDGNYGFVTCGHGFTGLWESAYNLNGSLLGTVTYRNFISSTSVDAAFVEYENQNDATNQYLGGGVISGVMPSSSLAIGMSVSKYGNATGLQSGTVSSVNTSVQFVHGDGATRVLNNQVALNTNQQKGDSGCAVVYSGNVVGIATLSNLTNAAWVSKAENINSRFDLTVYLAA